MHLVSADHLELKYPYKSDVSKYSPLFLDALKNLEFSEYAELSKEWNNLDQQPLDVVQLITGIPFHKFKPRTASRTNSFKPVFTLNNLVDVRFRMWDDRHLLESIVVHGKGWQVVPYSVQKMVATASNYGLKLDVVHCKFDVSGDEVSFETIDNHFTKKSFTSNATATQFISEDKATGKATGWRVGSTGHNGYTVSFYEASKVHYELPAGTWRIEVQAKGKAASELLAESDLTAAVLALVNNRIKFRSLTSNNSNRSQRPIPRWWNSIVQGAGSFRVTHSNSTPVLENRKKRLVSDLYSRCTSLGEPVFTEALQNFVQQFLPSFKLVQVGG